MCGRVGVKNKLRLACLCVVIMCGKQMKIMKSYMLMLAVCGLFWGSHVEPRLPSALVVVVMKFIM